MAALGPLGSFLVTVNATVGGVAVSGTIDGTVTSGSPTQITITPDAPTDIP